MQILIDSADRTGDYQYDASTPCVEIARKIGRRVREQGRGIIEIEAAGGRGLEDNCGAVYLLAITTAPIDAEISKVLRDLAELAQIAVLDHQSVLAELADSQDLTEGAMDACLGWWGQLLEVLESIDLLGGPLLGDPLIRRQTVAEIGHLTAAVDAEERELETPLEGGDVMEVFGRLAALAVDWEQALAGNLDD